jgi:hypothetical protein
MPAVDASWGLIDRLPTAAEDRRLAEAVGWSDAFDWDTGPGSPAWSFAGVIAVQGDETAGMARLVGDGVK